MKTYETRLNASALIQVFLIGSFISFMYAPAVLTAENPSHPSNGIGISYSMQGDIGLMQPFEDESITAENPLYQRIVADRARIEQDDESFDWEQTDVLIDAYKRAGYMIVFALSDSQFRHGAAGEEPQDVIGTYVEGWLRFVRQSALRYKGKVDYFEVWNSPDRMEDTGVALSEREYAFLFKNSSIQIRSEVPAAIVLPGAFDIRNSGWLKNFYSHESAIYSDVIFLRYRAGTPIDDDYATIEKIVLENDPSSKIWLCEEWGESQPRQRDIVNSFVSARERGSDLIIFSVSSPQVLDDSVRTTLLRCHSLFTPAYSKSYEEKPSVTFFSKSGERLSIQYSRYFNVDEFMTIISYHADHRYEKLQETIAVEIAERDLKAAYLYDTGGEIWGKIIRFERIRGEEGEKSIFKAELPLRDYPLFIMYRVRGASPGAGDIAESVEVTGKRLISADEIIAKHQEFQASQDEKLQNYIARGNIDFHFKMGGASGTVDVSIASNFFWKRGEGPEWEQTEYFINGNRLNWKKIPEIPLVQPEKVVVLPLDIHLDKNYGYEYAGEDRVQGRDCYVLEFNPAQEQENLYRGKVWIDQTTYAMVKLYTVQTGVKAPVISSEEETFYEPVRGSDGFEYWLMKRLEGQQIFSAGGRNFIVLREVGFSGFDINSARFAEKQAIAHDSDHQILKDTDRGYRYFSKNEQGERVIKEEIDTNQVLAVGGVYKDNSFDNPIPLAGVNFFDYNFRKKGIQMNLFFAGILATLNVTDPDFLASRFDFGLDFVGLGIKREDRLFERGTEIEERNVKYLSQYLGINIGYPFADFFKVRTTLNIDFTSFSRSDETLSSFVVPSDTVVYGIGLIGEFNKSGYGVQVGTSYSKRSRWEPWGECDPITGVFPEYSPDHKDFVRFFASASKEFYFPYFQKLRFEEEWMSGSDLDRFSKYSIGYFVTRVRGFGGSGIRFETGSITRGQYSFNLFKVVRFDAQIDHAIVKDAKLSDDYLKFTGAGITANFVGPWKTLIALDYGYAMRSEIEELEGSHEFLVVVFKLF